MVFPALSGILASMTVVYVVLLIRFPVHLAHGGRL